MATNKETRRKATEVKYLVIFLCLAESHDVVTARLDLKRRLERSAEEDIVSRLGSKSQLTK